MPHFRQFSTLIKCAKSSSLSHYLFLIQMSLKLSLSQSMVIADQLEEEEMVSKDRLTCVSSSVVTKDEEDADEEEEEVQVETVKEEERESILITCGDDGGVGVEVRVGRNASFKCSPRSKDESGDDGIDVSWR